jgi:hypothetical protein
MVDVIKREEEEAVQTSALEQTKADTAQGLVQLNSIRKQSEEVFNQLKDQIPEGQNKQLLDEVTNDPKALKREVDRVNNKKTNSEGSMKESFLDSIAFFIPAAIGGLVGGALGGSDAALGGIESGQKLGEKYFDYMDKKQEKAKSKSGNYIQGQYTLKDGNTPVAYETKTNTWWVGDKQVDARDVQNSIDSRTEFTQGKIDSRQEINLVETRANRKLAIEKFGFSKQQAQELSDPQLKTVSELNNALSSVKRIEALFKNADTGPIIGRVQNLSKLADASPDIFNQLQAEVNAARLVYQRATSGLQVNEKEMDLIDAIIPNINDQPGVFSSKMKVFKNILEANKGAFLDAVTSGQPIKQKAVKDILVAEGSRFKIGVKSDNKIPKDQRRKRIEEIKKKYNIN